MRRDMDDRPGIHGPGKGISFVVEVMKRHELIAIHIIVRRKNFGALAPVVTKHIAIRLSAEAGRPLQELRQNVGDAERLRKNKVYEIEGRAFRRALRRIEVLFCKTAWYATVISFNDAQGCGKSRWVEMNRFFQQIPEIQNVSLAVERQAQTCDLVDRLLAIRTLLTRQDIYDYTVERSRQTMLQEFVESSLNL